MALDVEVAYLFGFVLVVVGLLVVAVSLIFASRRRSPSGGKADVRGAGVLMIGPIPIIFGTDKRSVKEAIVLALAITIVVLILTVVYYWWLR
ncbi:MAG TPA: DUF131 domain-containing protein [Candidatus Deferrimicrobiaceae bacterium]|nr:DUF131 domain-containing protein [Candidatus Deferrimicrobiaceae bacterium]